MKRKGRVGSQFEVQTTGHRGIHLQPLEDDVRLFRRERIDCRRLNGQWRAENVEEAGDESSPKSDDDSVLDVVREVLGEGEEVGVEEDGER